MSKLVRPEVGVSKGVPKLLFLDLGNLNGNNHIQSHGSNVEVGGHAICTARLGREKKTCPQILRRVPVLSGGRIANQKTFNRLREVWGGGGGHIKIYKKDSSSSSKEQEVAGNIIKYSSGTIYLPRESASQQPATKPEMYWQIKQREREGRDMAPTLPRPMTKRQNYDLVSWHGPRCSVSKKWSSEIRPALMPAAPRPAPRPAPRSAPRSGSGIGSQTLSSPSRRLVPPSLQSSTKKDGRDKRKESCDDDRNMSRNNSDSVYNNLLNAAAEHWPTTAFSRAGKIDRHSRRRHPHHRRNKKRSTRIQPQQIPLDASVGGTVVKIGTTFLPSISRRMR